ncbi:MAG: hypothetical protein IPK26_25640 [Planctomycetes bacterium]|nr:hypothetical protein [Planctomycetota bacterium]
MTTTPLHEQAEERLFDALLDEALVAPPAANARSSRQWLAAALMLLGIGVAIGVAVLARPSPTAPAQDPEPAPASLPPAVRIEGRAALEDLLRTAPGTRNLWCVLEPDDIATLASFPDVEQLLLEPRIDSAKGKPVGGWDVTPLRACRKLRSLTLGILPMLPPAQLASLRALPALHEFGLTGTSWVLDAPLAEELNQLAVRSLKLLAVRCTPDGFARMGEHPLLEQLELWNVLFLRRCDLTKLGRLRQLRRLALIGVGDRMADAFERENPLPGDPPPEPGAGGGPQAGSLAMRGDQSLVLTPAAMRALADLPNLRELDLRSSVVDAATLAALPPGLQRLGLQDLSLMTPDALASIQERTVDSLSISVGVEAAVPPEASPSRPAADTWGRRQDATCNLIRRLAPRVLRFEGWITDGVGDLLASLTNVEELEFSQVGSERVIHTAMIAKMIGLRVLRLRHIPDDAPPEPLRQLPKLQEVHLIDATSAIVERYRQVLGDRVTIHVHDS